MVGALLEIRDYVDEDGCVWTKADKDGDGGPATT